MSRTTGAPSPASGTAPTAAQKIVATMWTLGKPATTTDIAAAAGVGSSTATPILRHLLATDQAVRTGSPQGITEWQLTATLTSVGKPPATSEHDPIDAADSDSDGTGADAHIDASSEPEPVPADTTPADPAATSPDAPDSTAIPAATVPDDPDADPPSSRTYRKAVQPRRPKGALRAAVLAALKAAPDQPFKVSEVCKAIDAANADSASNRAGAGAVANALDTLVGSGDAIRIEDSKYATYQAAL